MKTNILQMCEQSYSVRGKTVLCFIVSTIKVSSAYIYIYIYTYKWRHIVYFPFVLGSFSVIQISNTNGESGFRYTEMSEISLRTLLPVIE